jgi:metal-responsive CopG/Arc/MetJ family transcriptional regulator
MYDLTRGERLQIMLTKEEVEALDNWRFEKRMPSRASAVRELLKRGLTAEGFDLAGQGTKSRDFGMLDGQVEVIQQPTNGSVKTS